MSDLAAQLEAALAGRGGRKVGDEIKFACPAHEDQSPSAEWNRRKDVWNCPVCGAGGTSRDLATRLGIAVEERRTRPRELVASYEYRDAEGTVRFRKARYAPKDFMLESPDPDRPGAWRTGLHGAPPLLYRLPEMLASPVGRVYLVEGEKDADNLHRLGLIATTNPEGAQGRAKNRPMEPGPQKWKPAIYNPWLRGRDVVIVPDNDEAGEDLANFVAGSLAGVAASVRVLHLPDLPPKGDVSDWLLKGGSKGEIEALADAATEWAAPSPLVGPASFPETDAGNAELVASLYGDRVRYDHQRGRWLVWDQHRWTVDPDMALWRMAIDAARTRARAASDLPGDRSQAAFKFAKASESTGKVEAMLKQLRAVAPIADRGLGWDANPLLLGCENGIVNLSTGGLRAGRREDRITMTTGVVYDPAATAPRWERFMEEVFPDAGVREYVRLAAGYSITGITREQIWFLCYGTGANGKGTFIDAIRWAVGDYGHVMAFSTIEKGKEQSIPADMAALVSRRVVTASETEDGSRINDARVKSLTGQDPITARELYHPQFTFTPELKLWLAVNHKPRVADDSEGFWRRVRLIPFTQAFTSDKRDDNLKETLREELPGILAWLVRAAVDWHRKGLPVPPAIAVLNVEYRQDSDVLAPFITARCALVDQAEVGASKLYKVYKAWAEDEGMGAREIMSATLFGRKLAERFRRVERSSGRAYIGIGLQIDGFDPKPSTEWRVAESIEGFSQTNSGVAYARTESYPEMAPQPSNPPFGVLRCECGPRHPGEECADGDWITDDEGGEHCLQHCQIKWEVA